MPDIIDVAATLGQDDSIRDRVTFAEDTVAQFLAGNKITGGPKLAAEIGKDVVARLREWLPTKTADADRMDGFVTHNGKIVADHQGNISRAVELCGVEFSYNLTQNK